MSMVPDEERARIATMDQEDQRLLEACGHSNPDDASTFLIDAFWRHLRDLLPKLH